MERETFICAHRSAASKAGPIDTNDLFKRLTDARDTKPSRLQLNERSPTCSPPPYESNVSYEAFCHNELLTAGGKPAVSLDRLSPGAGDLQQEIAAWLSNDSPKLEEGDVPAILSTQLEHWNVFRQRWQWDNRGKAAGEAGFPAYLAGERRLLMHKGEVDVAYDPSFEDTMRRGWDYDGISLEESGNAGFAAYAEAVTKRLATHHFTRQYRLLEDPRQQDEWTTWVEYLSYVYWWQDKHATSMKVAEPRYRKAWENLESIDWPSSSSSVTTEAVTQELETFRGMISSIPRFLGGTRAYRRAEAAYRREEHRAQWILEQLLLMESMPCETGSHDTNGGTWRKRKRKDDTNDTEPHSRPKRTKDTRPNGTGDTASEPFSTVMEENGIARASSAGM